MNQVFEDLSQERVMAELAAIGFARAGEFLCGGDLSAVSPETMAAVASLERTASGYKLKFYDKLKALELMGRYLGMAEFRERGDENLLRAILNSTQQKGEFDGFSDLWQEAEACHDVVEAPRDEGI